MSLFNPLAQRDPVLDVLSRRPETGAIGPIGQMQTVAQPFTWGAGGTQRTPEQLASEREVAQALSMPNYSPVGSVWEGVGRVFDNVGGALDLKRIDDEQAQAQQRRSASATGLLGAGNEDLAAAFSSGDPVLEALAAQMFRSRNAPPPEASIQRANNGDILGIDPRTGQVVFQHSDPNPKPVLDWITSKDPTTGQTILTPFGANGPLQGGGGPPSGAGGFGAPSPSNVPSGPPTQGWPPPEAISELMRNPGSSAQFDAVFGAGMAARILGK